MLIKLGSDEYFAEYEQKEGIKYVQDILLLRKNGDSIDKSKTK